MTTITNAPAEAIGNQLSWRLLPLVVAALPFLDFPGIGGGAYVKPLALPLAVLVVGLAILLSYGDLRIPFDAPLKLVLLFIAWAMAGALVLPLLANAPGEMKGQLLVGRIVRDLLSLLGGVTFYICLRTAITHADRAEQAARWMMRTYWLMLPFVTVQALVVLTGSDLALALDSVLSIMRSDLQGHHYRKVFGLAPEASMLADQLLSLYLPFVIAALILGTTLLRRRLLGLRQEILMLAVGLLVLVFTQSRIGFVTLLYLVGCGMAAAALRRPGGWRHVLPVGVAMLVLIGSTTAMLLTVAGEQVSDFLATFASVDQSIDEGVWSNITRLGSMMAGFDMALAHPLGVGTGAFPFLFERHVPQWALISPEIQALLGTGTDYLQMATGSTGGDIESRLPDAKALPARVAAELGIPGLVLLGTLWLMLVRRCWRVVCQPHRDTLRETVALGALLSLFAMLPLSLSSNSYIWVHWIFVAALASVIRPTANK